MQPRSARPGQPVALIVTVWLNGGLGDLPTGSVTLLDGTTDLGTVALSRGKARLVTTGLVPGRNKIQVQYDSGPDMVLGGATLIETIRRQRARSKFISQARIG